MTKHLMFNAKTKEVKVTNAKVDGEVYQGYLKSGFKHIGYVDGFNVTVSNLIKTK
jgi:hypothetical protein